MMARKGMPCDSSTLDIGAQLIRVEFKLHHEAVALVVPPSHDNVPVIIWLKDKGGSVPGKFARWRWCPVALVISSWRMVFRIDHDSVKREIFPPPRRSSLHLPPGCSGSARRNDRASCLSQRGITSQLRWPCTRLPLAAQVVSSNIRSDFVFIGHLITPYQRSASYLWLERGHQSRVGAAPRNIGYQDVPLRRAPRRLFSPSGQDIKRGDKVAVEARRRLPRVQSRDTQLSRVMVKFTTIRSAQGPR